MLVNVLHAKDDLVALLCVVLVDADGINPDDPASIGMSEMPEGSP